MGKSSLQSIEKKQTGSLVTRNVADLVKKEHFVMDSEYLVTLLVVVPLALQPDWNNRYEKLTDMIVPRSSQLIYQDNDHALVSVTLFQKVVDEFKTKVAKQTVIYNNEEMNKKHRQARENKFLVRDFTYNEEALKSGL